ncbi:MAG: ferritin-like domain-containing protein [Acidimicrobiales bacterium]
MLTALQQALELEHSTIPPYLYALYSLVPGTNDAVAEVIESVAVEEMLHLTLVANVINGRRGGWFDRRPGTVFDRSTGGSRTRSWVWATVRSSTGPPPDRTRSDGQQHRGRRRRQRLSGDRHRHRPGRGHPD